GTERRQRPSRSPDRDHGSVRRELPRDGLFERIRAAHSEQLEEGAARRQHRRGRQLIVLERTEVQDRGSSVLLTEGVGVRAGPHPREPERKPTDRDEEQSQRKEGTAELTGI